MIGSLAMMDARRRGEKAAPAVRKALAWAIGPGRFAPNQLGKLVSALVSSRVEASDEVVLTKIYLSEPVEDEEYWSGPSDAARAFVNLGGGAVSRLRENWKQGLVPDGIYASALESVSGPEAFKLIEEAVLSGRANLRASCIQALGGLVNKEPRAASLLMKLREDSNHQVFGWRLVSFGEPESVLAQAKGENVPGLESGLKKVDDGFLSQLLTECSSVNRSTVAAELVRRKFPQGKSALTSAICGVTGEEHVRSAYRALSIIPANEQIFRACLSAQSASVRGLAFLRLQSLLNGDATADPFPKKA